MSDKSVPPGMMPYEQEEKYVCYTGSFMQLQPPHPPTLKQTKGSKWQLYQVSSSKFGHNSLDWTGTKINQTLFLGFKAGTLTVISDDVNQLIMLFFFYLLLYLSDLSTLL